VLGGINIPNVPPAAKQAAENPLLYFIFSISGKATAPMVAVVAALDPQIAANPAEAPILAMDNPPGRCPNHLLVVLKRSSLIPE